MTDKTINFVKSDSVQEIIDHTPSWIFKWGISGVGIIIVFFIIMSWVIRYPDIIKGSCVVSTKNTSIELVTKATGEIEQLSLKENSFVNKGQLIATISNSIDSSSHKFLKNLHSTFSNDFNSSLLNFDFNDKKMNFGILNNQYQNFKNLVLNYRFYQKNDITFKQIQSLKDQIQNYKSLIFISIEQVKNTEYELFRIKEKLISDRKLFSKNVISQFELYETEKIFLSSKTNLSNLKKNVIQNKITLTELKQKLIELETQLKLSNIEKIQTLNNILLSIKNNLIELDRIYKIKAPISGKLSFSTKLTNSTFVQSGETLFIVSPQNQSYIGTLNVPTSGYGKIKIGQKVRVRIDNYPSHEFGYLNGVITSLTAISRDKNYRVHFKLTKKLISSYGKLLPYTPEMNGNAEVITDDLRLIQRFINKLKEKITIN